MPLKSRRQRRASKRRDSKRRQRKQQGGAGPVGVYDLGSPSDAQGRVYQEAHRAQHGGMAPVGYTGVMEDAQLRLSARVTPLDDALNAVKHIRDPGQAGGAKKRRGSKKSRKAGKKSRKAGKKSRSQTRKQRGGAAMFGSAEDYYGDAKGPHMLLSPAQELRAGLNPEWTLAKNPSAFAPQGR